MECFTHEQCLLDDLLTETATDEYYFPIQDQLNSTLTDNTNNPFQHYTTQPIDHNNFSLLYDDSFNTLQLETNQTFPYCWQLENYTNNYYSMFQDEVDVNGFQFPFKTETVQEIPCIFAMGQVSTEKGNKDVKVKSNQSKNLVAERRRRKRLNDRLSMLRSVVPKISKMDRTSILGDTIDYMKELLERISNLQQEMHLGSTQLSSITIFNDIKPHEILLRHSPKFDVEMRNNGETRIEMWCASKQGLLLSTVTTLEALGLEINQCVISCFNDFAAQASCSHLDLKHGALLDSEEIKEALFRNTGYART